MFAFADVATDASDEKYGEPVGDDGVAEEGGCSIPKDCIKYWKDVEDEHGDGNSYCGSDEKASESDETGGEYCDGGSCDDGGYNFDFACEILDGICVHLESNDNGDRSQDKPNDATDRFHDFEACVADNKSYCETDIGDDVEYDLCGFIGLSYVISEFCEVSKMVVEKIGGTS